MKSFKEFLNEESIRKVLHDFLDKEIGKKVWWYNPKTRNDQYKTKEKILFYIDNRTGDILKPNSSGKPSKNVIGKIKDPSTFKGILK